MPQIYYRANLADADFPLVSSFQGRTVIQGQLDQNYQQVATTGSEERKDRGIPEAYYMHNVIPSLQGYKSIRYNAVVSSIPEITDIKRVFACKDFAGNRGHLAVTSNGKTFLITNLAPTWKDVTPTSQPLNPDVTVANATGSTFICYAKFNIFTVDLVAGSLTIADLIWTGTSPAVTNASIVGIAASNNYLLCHDGATIYWSSSLNVLDFQPSQVTGAGSGVPTAIVGAIIAITTVNIGFAVCCQGNIVVALFSGNVQYPWIFKEAPNGSGLASVDHLSFGGDEGNVYAWTSAGLIRITLAGCTTIFPEVTDFLGGRIFEDFDTSTATLSISYITQPLMVRVAFVAARYVVVSYGLTSLTHALIYDSSLKRWGKLKLPHVQVVDLSFKLETSAVQYYTFNDLKTTTFIDHINTTFLNMKASSSNISAPAARNSIALVQADGTIQAIDFAYGTEADDCVLLLGKYQVYRLNLVTLQGFFLETIDATVTSFKVKVLTSFDGKNVGLTRIPAETIMPNMREYDITVTGTDHSLLLQGAFHLVGALLVFTMHGNR